MQIIHQSNRIAQQLDGKKMEHSLSCSAGFLGAFNCGVLSHNGSF